MNSTISLPFARAIPFNLNLGLKNYIAQFMSDLIKYKSQHGYFRGAMRQKGKSIAGL
ncbi:hypothetical protein VYA_10120 [Vibrio alfacsensis]|nr:hypothetical protein VYA_10120 [Vibrio alfacsensis]